MHEYCEYWLRLFQLDFQDVVKICYKCQLNKFIMESGAKKLKEEGGKIRIMIYLTLTSRE